MTKFYTCSKCKATVDPVIVVHLKAWSSYKAPYEASLCPRCQVKVKEFCEGDVKKVEPSGFAEIQKKILVLNRAFEMACDELGEFCCSRTMFKHKCDYDCVTHWKEYLLQKAGEADD